jgi:hypothetical protein
LEVNILPGLNPKISDLCIIANAEGMSYQDLILEQFLGTFQSTDESIINLTFPFKEAETYEAQTLFIHVDWRPYPAWASIVQFSWRECANPVHELNARSDADGYFLTYRPYRDIASSGINCYCPPHASSIEYGCPNPYTLDPGDEYSPTAGIDCHADRPPCHT